MKFFFFFEKIVCIKILTKMLKIFFVDVDSDFAGKDELFFLDLKREK